MKIPLTCSECITGKNEVIGFMAPLGDKGIYYHRCGEGHQSITVLNVHKHEILFQNGLWAITDGYFREAVSSFVASLENFYDFYVTVIFLKNKISEDMIAELIRKNNRSERKLGAYVATYLGENTKHPLVMNTTESNFRNDIIHNGKIPSFKESVEWAEKVREMIKPVSKELLDKFPVEFGKAINGDLSERVAEAKRTWPNVPLGTMGFGTAVSVLVHPPSDDGQSILKYIEQIESSHLRKIPYTYRNSLEL